MIEKILILILVTFIPFLELRLAIPLGILSGKVKFLGITFQGLGMPWPTVFITAIIANIILGILIYIFLDKFVHFFFRIKKFENFYHKKLERTQHKIKRYTDKYGLLGVALFIAIPLPGSGSYSGALGAYALGLSRKKFIAANALGVLIAGTAVTILTLAGIGLINLF